MPAKIMIGCLLGLLMGMVLGQLSAPVSRLESIACYAGNQELTIIGTVTEEPDVRREKTKYTIEVQQLKTTPETKLVSGLILISTEKVPAYAYGDELEITGKLEQPAVFDDFDYASYLSRYGITAVMNRPKIKNIGNSRSSSTITQFLLSIKDSFTTQLSLTFPSEPANSLMAGLLLGSRKGMPEELTRDFQIAGLTHIIAISGYNITLIVGILMALFRPLGRRASISFSAMGIIIFTLFVGASAAVIRACIMGLIGLMAIGNARKTSITITLLITAALMGLWNPKILLYDVGFQLSFLATMGLIYISPLLEPRLNWLPKKFVIRDSIAMTLSAQIMALPVLLLNFEQISLIAPLSNMLVAGPIIPFTMLFGFLATICSYASITVAKIIAFPGYFLSEYITNVVHLSSQIPYAAIEISWFSEALLMTYFTILIILLTKHWKLRQKIDHRIIESQLSFQQKIAQACIII